MDGSIALGNSPFIVLNGTPKECSVYRKASETAPHSVRVQCHFGAEHITPDGVSAVVASVL